MPHAPSALTAALVGIAALQPCAADDPKNPGDEQNQAPTAFAAAKPQPVLDWGTGDARSRVVPAVEIPTFEFLLTVSITTRSMHPRIRRPFRTSRTICTASGSWTTINSQPINSCIPIRDRFTRDSRARPALVFGRLLRTRLPAAFYGRRQGKTLPPRSTTRLRPASVATSSASRCSVSPASCWRAVAMDDRVGGASSAPRLSPPRWDSIAWSTASDSPRYFAAMILPSSRAWISGQI